MAPLVTILTSVYNHERYLDDYFQSIIDQTYENIELVLIDDCSTDGSRRVIETWLERLRSRFPSLIYLPREKNAGVIANLHEGIAKAAGKYICPFASDDMMDPNNIQEKAMFLENHQDFAFVYSDGYFVRDEATLRNPAIKKKISDHQKLEYDHVYQALIDNGNFIPALSVVYRRSVLLEDGICSEKYMFEDYQLVLNVTRHYNVGFIDKPLVYYRLSPHSLSRSPASFKQMIKDHEALLWDLKTNQQELDIEKGLEKVYRAGSIGFFKQNNREDFLYYYSRLHRKDILLRGLSIIIKIPFLYRIFILLRNDRRTT